MSTSRNRVYSGIVEQFVEYILEGKIDKAQKFLKEKIKVQQVKGETLGEKIYEKGIEMGNYSKLEKLKRHTVALLCFTSAYRLISTVKTKSELKENIAKAHFNLGVMYNEKGLLNEAEEHLRKAITNDSSFAQSYHELAMVQIKSGRPEEGRRSCLRALKIKPLYPQAYVTLGVALDDLNRPEEAERAFRSAIQMNPSLAQPYYNLGGLLSELGRLEEAEALCRRGVELGKRHPKAYHNLGLILGLARKYQEARQAFEMATEIDPCYALAYHNLGWVLRDSGKLKDAEKACRKAIELKPDFPEAYGNLGTILLDMGRMEEAEKTCRIAIELSPNDPRFYYELGRILHECILNNMKRFKDAEAALRKAIKIKGDHAEAYYTLGGVLYLEGKLEEAERVCRKAILLQPDDPNAYYNLSLTLKKVGRFHEAEKECKRAIQLDKNDPDHHSLLAAILIRMGRFEEAEKACRIAIQLNPKDFDGWYFIGKALWELGKLDEAEQMLRNAIKLKRSGAGYDLLGIILSQKGSLEKAEKVFREAIRLDPDNPRTYNNLGLTLVKMGRLKDSEEAYKRAIELNPNFAHAFCNLGGTLTDMKRFGEAERAYKRSIDLDPTLLKNASWNLGLLFFRQGILDYAIRWFSVAEEEFLKANEKKESLKTRSRILWAKGLKFWRSEDFMSATEYYNRASAILSEVGEDVLSRVLSIVSSCIALDKEYLEALRQDTLMSLRDGIKKISRNHQDILRNVCVAVFPEQTTIIAKFTCINTLLKSLIFKQVSFDHLDEARRTFRTQQFWKAVEGVNALESFVVEMRQYKRLDEISRTKEAKLLRLLRPIEILDGYLNGLIERKVRETLDHAYIYFPGSIEPTFVTPKRSEGLRKTSIHVQIKPSCERIYVDEIASFREVLKVAPHETRKLVPLTLSERKVKQSLANIIGEHFVSKDWGGEKSDLYTSHVIFDGKRIATAFLLKGPSVKRLTIDKCGKRGNQILRLVKEPASLFIVQHNGEIDSDVIELLETCVSDLATKRGVKLYYCVIDGVDTTRVLLAYEKLMHQRRRNLCSNPS